MRFKISTQGLNDIIDITPLVGKIVKEAAVKEGVAVIFAPGSTCAITAIEYEPGLIDDLKIALEKIAPQNAKYSHNSAWGDGNGYAHIRSAFLKPSLAVPVEGGKLVLGAWQQIVFIDFDNRPREREIIVKIIEGKL
jgi:secondary thiamine-phosphate synthase enzyme